MHFIFSFVLFKSYYSDRLEQNVLYFDWQNYRNLSTPFKGNVHALLIPPIYYLFFPYVSENFAHLGNGKSIENTVSRSFVLLQISSFLEKFEVISRCYLESVVPKTNYFRKRDSSHPSVKYTPITFVFDAKIEHSSCRVTFNKLSYATRFSCRRPFHLFRVLSPIYSVSRYQYVFSERGKDKNILCKPCFISYIINEAND